MTNTDIGTGAAALVCTTTFTPCCTSGNPETQWYFPNGSQVPNNLNLPYQRTRGRFPGRVILSRNSESSITGLFHCDIPDADNITQSLYVGIYDNSTGESCTLSEWLVIRKEIFSTSDKDSVSSVIGYYFPQLESIHSNLTTLVVWYTVCQMDFTWAYLCGMYRNVLAAVGVSFFAQATEASIFSSSKCCSLEVTIRRVSPEPVESEISLMSYYTT